MVMEFGIEKCSMLIIKIGKRDTVEGTELQNQESFRTFRENEMFHAYNKKMVKEIEWNE